MLSCCLPAAFYIDPPQPAPPASASSTPFPTPPPPSMPQMPKAAEGRGRTTTERGGGGNRVEEARAGRGQPQQDGNDRSRTGTTTAGQRPQRGGGWGAEAWSRWCAAGQRQDGVTGRGENFFFRTIGLGCPSNRMGKKFFLPRTHNTCDAYTPGGEPIPTNKRFNAEKIFGRLEVKAEEPWS